MKNDRLITFCLLVLILLAPSQSLCQQFQDLNAEFPMGASETIFQDSAGFIWIGTNNGLVRFDGYETHFYTHDPTDPTSISGNNIISMGEDHLGRIWVGMRAFGLDILDAEGKAFTHVCFPDSAGQCLTEMSVPANVYDPQAGFWVGTQEGLYLFSTGDQPQILRRFTADKNDPYSLNSDVILELLVDSHGRLWVGTREGINLFDRENARFINAKTNKTFAEIVVLDINEDRHGAIWVSLRFGEQRLIIFDESSQNFLYPPQFRNYWLGELTFAFDHKNALWLCSRGTGAFHLDNMTQELTYYDPQHSALHGYRTIYGLKSLCDRYGNIWMTGSSVMKRPATGKAMFHFAVAEAPVVSVFADDTYIWFSDLEPKRFDRKTGGITPFWSEYLPNDIRIRAEAKHNSRRVYCIQEYDDDRIVMTSTRNVFLWNPVNDTYKEYPLDIGGPFRDFIVDDDRKNLWICGNQGRPIYFDLHARTASYPDEVRDVLNPRCLAKSPTGDIWFGTSTDGVYKFDRGVGQVINFSPHSEEPDKRLSDFFVRDIAIDAHAVWVATNLGVNRIDLETLTVTYLRKQENFQDESVLALLPDDLGDIWLGTQKGLVRYDPETESFLHFDQHDGLINRVYTEGTCYKDARGYLYFGGDRGVDYFDPSRIGINSIPPDVYISRLLVNNQPADTALAPHHLRHLALAHTQNFIEVELLAMHFTAPMANQYAYQIPEIDAEWRDLGRHRTITLVNMRPGSYTLRVRAANADGVWSQDKGLLQISIRPPFWETWWFIVLCALCFGMILALAYRYRIQQIKTREQLKSDFNKRIAEMESRALRAQMNPHFLFNSINSVKSLISQGENVKATQYLTRFGQLLRQVLANSEQHLVRLQEELEALRLYLDIEQLRFQNFEYNLTVDEGVNADFVEVPPLILQPYVENAIWHGLMHKTSGDRNVSVCVRRDGDFLHMTVQDNGIGRARAKQLKMLGNARKGGMGMRLTGDRLLLLHKLYGREVRVVVEDLHENGTATGTRVEISIPCME